MSLQFTLSMSEKEWVWPPVIGYWYAELCTMNSPFPMNTFSSHFLHAGVTLSRWRRWAGPEQSEEPSLDESCQRRMNGLVFVLCLLNNCFWKLVISTPRAMVGELVILVLWHREGEQSLKLHRSGFESQRSHSSFTLNDLLNLTEVPHFTMKTRCLPSGTTVNITDKKWYYALYSA